MSQYNNGTVATTNGSAIITGTSTAWLASIVLGDGFTVSGSGVTYDVASIDSDTQITLSAPYAAATASNQYYTIIRDFTPVLGLPYPSQGDQDTATVVKTALQKLDAGITVTSLKHRGDWLAGATYTTDDAVHSAGRYFVSIVANNTGNTPPAIANSTVYWQLVADKGGAVADRLAAESAALNAASDRVQTGLDRSSVSADSAAAEIAAAAAEADRIAVQAAWTAALSANPDLNPPVRMNPQQVVADLAIPDNYNAYASGPLEIAKGVTITVGANANLNII